MAAAAPSLASPSHEEGNASISGLGLYLGGEEVCTYAGSSTGQTTTPLPLEKCKKLILFCPNIYFNSFSYHSVCVYHLETLRPKGDTHNSDRLNFIKCISYGLGAYI